MPFIPFATGGEDAAVLIAIGVVILFVALLLFLMRRGSDNDETVDGNAPDPTQTAPLAPTPYSDDMPTPTEMKAGNQVRVADVPE
jgi:LPXTG-motif cell wall-anchored protein